MSARRRTPILFIALACALMLQACGDPPPPDPAETARAAQNTAVGACRELILRVLRDPASAEFEPPNMAAVNFADGVWTIQRRVRAQNGFGGMTSQLMQCQIRQQGSEWLPVDIKKIRR